MSNTTYAPDYAAESALDHLATAVDDLAGLDAKLAGVDPGLLASAGAQGLREAFARQADVLRTAIDYWAGAAVSAGASRAEVTAITSGR